MRGKFSPTVSNAYCRNASWFLAYAKEELYDPEGYDAYGYDANDIDRAGNEEYEYYPDDDEVTGTNNAYEEALSSWGFDGTKPVKKK